MKNKTYSVYYIFLIACLSFISAQQTYAQDNDIKELNYNNNISSKNSSSKKTVSKNTDRSDFYNLALKLQPSIYIENNSIKKSNGHKKPLKIVCLDVQSFSILEQAISSNRKVEILEISLKTTHDLNTRLDLSDNEEFGHIKYIYVKSNFTITETQIRNLITLSPDSDVRIFYKTETPS